MNRVDDIGLELPSLEMAYLEAFKAAQEMWSDLLVSFLKIRSRLCDDPGRNGHSSKSNHRAQATLAIGGDQKREPVRADRVPLWEFCVAPPPQNLPPQTH